jgi:hypothetical protein
MRKRLGIVVAVIVVVGALAAGLGPGRHLAAREATRSDLHRAASDFCACAVGKRDATPASALGAIEISIAAGNDQGRGKWPDRCQSYYDAARAAYERAASAGLVSSTLPSAHDALHDPRAFDEAVTMLSAFWTDDPAPSVPLPPEAARPLVELGAASPLAAAAANRIASERRENGKLVLSVAWPEGENLDCTLDESLVASCSPEGAGKTIPLEAEPGARKLARRYVVKPDGTVGDAQIVDEGGAIVASTYAGFEWGRSLADGRVLTFEEGRIVERKGNQRRASELYFPGNKSTKVVGSWLLYKGVAVKGEDPSPIGGAYPLAVVDLSAGVNAQPVVLSASEDKPPNAAVARRTYGACTADATFVDMDPKLAVHAKTGPWKLHPLDWPTRGRHLSCRGETAMVTDWFPLSVQRCTVAGCTKVPTGDYGASLVDELAADESTLWAARYLQGALLLTIVPLAHPEQRKTVVLAMGVRPVDGGDDEGGMLHVMGGNVVVLFSRQPTERVGYYRVPTELYAVAVSPEGKVLNGLSNRLRAP